MIVGISQIFIACATPRDVKKNAAQNSSASNSQALAPKTKSTAGANTEGSVPGKEKGNSEGLSAFQQEMIKREEAREKREEKRHQEKMELEHARIKSFEASQAQLFDYLRDSSEKQQLTQIGMMATLSQLFPKTEAANLSFDEDCFVEKIVSLEATLRKAKDKINEQRKASSAEGKVENSNEVADAADQVPHLLARPAEDEGVVEIKTQVSNAETASTESEGIESVVEEPNRRSQVNFVRIPSRGSLWSSNKSSK
ncbi:MAG: hypothetical protein ACO3LE_00410 [Bdellovibrionota bacterium]